MEKRKVRPVTCLSRPLLLLLYMRQPKKAALFFRLYLQEKDLREDLQSQLDTCMRLVQERREVQGNSLSQEEGQRDLIATGPFSSSSSSSSNLSVLNQLSLQQKEDLLKVKTAELQHLSDLLQGYKVHTHAMASALHAEIESAYQRIQQLESLVQGKSLHLERLERDLCLAQENIASLHSENMKLSSLLSDCERNFKMEKEKQDQQLQVYVQQIEEQKEQLESLDSYKKWLRKAQETCRDLQQELDETRRSLASASILPSASSSSSSSTGVLIDFPFYDKTLREEEQEEENEESHFLHSLFHGEKREEMRVSALHPQQPSSLLFSSSPEAFLALERERLLETLALEEMKKEKIEELLKMQETTFQKEQAERDEELKKVQESLNAETKEKERLLIQVDEYERKISLQAEEKEAMSSYLQQVEALLQEERYTREERVKGEMQAFELTQREIVLNLQRRYEEELSRQVEDHLQKIKEDYQREHEGFIHQQISYIRDLGKSLLLRTQEEEKERHSACSSSSSLFHGKQESLDKCIEDELKKKMTKLLTENLHQREKLSLQEEELEGIKKRLHREEEEVKRLKLQLEERREEVKEEAVSTRCLYTSGESQVDRRRSEMVSDKKERQTKQDQGDLGEKEKDLIYMKGRKEDKEEEQDEEEMTVIGREEEKEKEEEESRDNNDGIEKKKKRREEEEKEEEEKIMMRERIERLERELGLITELNRHLTSR
ncbi:hypothetical protein CSUI_001300, partial [Cystoisospora suis]